MAEMGFKSVNADGKRARGGSNANERGGSEERRRRRAWLVQTYRADVDVLVVQVTGWGPSVPYLVPVPIGTPHMDAQAACRCYRCGVLLTVDMVSADRIIPGCQGGTYRRDNIRPACGSCNSITGATTRRKGTKR